MEHLDVIVVGGGIGGLTAAIALQRDGHRVRIFDQVRELRPVGAGISLWSNGVKVLNALGLGDEIAAIGGTMQRLSYCDPSGSTLCDFSLDPLVDQVGQQPYPVRRADLQTMLLRAAGDHLAMGQRCVAITERASSIVVTTEGGDELEGDLVVIADGTHSRLRSFVVDEPVERSYIGYHNWNGIVPDESALGPPSSWTVHVGEGKRVSTMPVRDGQYFFFDVPLPTAERTEAAPQDVLRDHFRGWSPAVQQLIDAIDPIGVANVAIHSHRPLTSFARGRAVIVGDAAHTTAPDLGQGGCLAMEDALVLASHLAADADVESALARYSAERVPRAAQIIDRATKRAHLSHSHDPERTEAWYRELAGEDGSNIIAGISASILSGPLG